MKKTIKYIFNKLSITIIVIFIVLFLFSIKMINESLAEEIVNEFPENGQLENNKTYVLTSDIELKTNLTVKSGYVVTIDLNGYVLKGNENGPVIRNSGTLTILDSSPNRKTSYFEKSETSAWKWLPDVQDDNNGTYAAITGGIITGGNEKTAPSESGGGGGAIKMNSNALNNTLYLKGGNIVGNKTMRAGGAFYGGKVTMSGGKIIGNYAGGFSAAISISGDFTITGGEISKENYTGNNSTYTENSSMVVGTKSNFIMSGGKIEGLITTSTSASTNSFTMTGGEVIGTLEIKNQMDTIISGGVFTGNIIMSNGNCTVSENAVIQNGSVENGGCILIKKGLFIMEGGIIRDCNAIQNGGAVNIESGTAKITGGIVENCSATNGGAIYVSGGDFELSGSGKIENCTATNGGAVYVSEGNVLIGGGTINNCQATNGGNIYISGGDININQGTIVGGKAANGGGIYISNGNITMNGGSISNNYATECGGGIYASSDTQDLNISVISGSIRGNIANKHGGGIGVNVGTGFSATVIVGLETCKGLDEEHSHPIIEDNIANEKGGGFCLHGDSLSMTMYCGTIEANIATQEPGSSNINQIGGTVTVYGGIVKGGITIIGGRYLYHPDDNVGIARIVYDANIPGTEQTEVSEISSGITISLPKSFFTRENFILVGWCEVQNPTDSDTIYATGEEYTVPTGNVVLYAKWLRIGIGTVEEPTIKSGKHYGEFAGESNVMISCDSAFTTKMSVKNMHPSLYNDRTLSFDRPLIKGTFITMIDLTKENERNYYYYEVNDEKTMTIQLESFIKMGDTINYINSDITDFADETFIFIIELPNENTITGATQMTLTRYSTDSEVASIEQTLSYTTTPKREFNLMWDNQPGDGENVTVADNFNISYEKSNIIGEDSKYTQKSMSLVIYGANDEKIPSEAKLYDGTDYYTLNTDRQFIIPFGNVNENRNISLKLISKNLLLMQEGFNLKVELWVSEDSNGTSPFMGERVATIDNISLLSAKLPAFNLNMKKRIYNVNNFGGKIELNYNARNIEDYSVTLELQKKNEKYETQKNMLISVNNMSLNENGIFSIDVNENGVLKLELLDSTIPNVGTYRILVKIMRGEKIIYMIPYNFILVD